MERDAVAQVSVSTVNGAGEAFAGDFSPRRDGASPRPDNVLPYSDQALFRGLREAGHEAVIQVFWLYERPLDPEGLCRFHDNLRRGLLARLIEPSVLPFGRHRWVAPAGSAAEPDLGAAVRSRAEFYDWADEQVGLPLDPQWGPAWRLAAQAFSDGTTAVSLVVSHCIADGGAVVIALDEACRGVVRELGYPPPGSRPYPHALGADLRRALRDSGETARTLGKAARVALRRRHDLVSAKPLTPPINPADRPASVPSATAFVDAGQWDSRAAQLGGNSFSLVAAFAARCAELLGRNHEHDGMVTLTIPVDQRDHPGDTRGNVVGLASVSVDPAGLRTDLTAARAAIRAGLRRVRDVPDEIAELSPLVPFVPKRALARIAELAFGFSADPVSVSNMGNMPAEITGVDGTAADYFWFRGMDRNVTRAALERRRGVLTVMSGTVAGRVIVTVIGYQPGSGNTRSGLAGLIRSVLREFELVAELV